MLLTSLHYLYGTTRAGATFVSTVHTGTWDLPVQLRREAAAKKVLLASYWTKFYDLRAVYTWWLQATEVPKRATSTSLTTICSSLGIAVHGTLHSGVDDATTIAKCTIAILQKLRKVEAGAEADKEEEGEEGEHATDGTNATIPRGEPFPSPMDWQADVASFRQARGVAFKVESMGYAATRADIIDWLRSFDGVVGEDDGVGQESNGGRGDGGSSQDESKEDANAADEKGGGRSSGLGCIVSIERAMYPDGLLATGCAYVTLNNAKLAAAVVEATSGLVGTRSVFVRAIMPFPSPPPRQLPPNEGEDLGEEPEEGASNPPVDLAHHHHQQVDATPRLPFPPTVAEFVAQLGTTIYVFNLPWQAEPALIEAWCLHVGGERERAASIKVSTVSENNSRLSGFAIVRYTSPTAAESALLNGSATPIAGRFPSVRPIASDEIAFAESVSTWRQISTANVLAVSNLDPRATVTDLTSYFGQFGGTVVQSIHYRNFGNHSLGNGRGRVTFTSAVDALHVCRLFQQQHQQQQQQQQQHEDGGRGVALGGLSDGIATDLANGMQDGDVDPSSADNVAGAKEARDCPAPIPALMTTMPRVASAVVETSSLAHQEDHLEGDGGVALFVGGLHPTTTRESLMQTVGQYGHITAASVKHDQTGMGNHYGFVTVTDKSLAYALLGTWSFKVDGKQVNFKRATGNASGGGGAVGGASGVGGSMRVRSPARRTTTVGPTYVKAFLQSTPEIQTLRPVSPTVPLSPTVPRSRLPNKDGGANPHPHGNVGDTGTAKSPAGARGADAVDAVLSAPLGKLGRAGSQNEPPLTAHSHGILGEGVPLLRSLSGDVVNAFGQIGTTAPWNALPTNIQAGADSSEDVVVDKDCVPIGQPQLTSSTKAADAAAESSPSHPPPAAAASMTSSPLEQMSIAPPLSRDCEMR